MGLKINGSTIKTIRVNGSEISLGKLNGYVIFSKQNTPEIPSTMGSEWLDYGNPHFDGVRAYDALDAWIWNSSSGNTINGVYLDLVVGKTCEFKMRAKYYSYAGAPTKYCVFVLDSNNNDAIVTGYNYNFDSNGTETTRELTINLEKGNYKVVIGSKKEFEFGVAVTQISLTEV